jgi:hypothetical protein
MKNRGGERAENKEWRTGKSSCSTTSIPSEELLIFGWTSQLLFFATKMVEKAAAAWLLTSKMGEKAGHVYPGFKALLTSKMGEKAGHLPDSI